VDRLGHLHCQLTRGHEHQPGRPAPILGPEAADAVQHRQGERRGLAGAGRGLRQQVAAAEQQRNRLALHRRGLFVAERGDRRHDGIVESKGAEPGRGGRRRSAVWHVCSPLSPSERPLIDFLQWTATFAPRSTPSSAPPAA
jgi:hypothetical protein